MIHKGKNYSIKLRKYYFCTRTLKKRGVIINNKKLYSIALVSIAMLLMLVSIAGAAPFAYITNSNNNNVSVIDTETNNVTATVNVGWYPVGVAVNPDEKNVYVANMYNDNVSVINTTTNNITATVPVGNIPFGVAVTPDGSKVYVTNYGNDSVSGNTTSVIDTTKHCYSHSASRAGAVRLRAVYSSYSSKAENPANDYFCTRFGYFRQTASWTSQFTDCQTKCCNEEYRLWEL